VSAAGPVYWVLRRAGTDDLDSIMALETSTFGTDAWSQATMLADVANTNCHYLVAHREESPALIEGYAGLLAPRGGNDGDIQTIAVSLTARRLGLGRSLMNELIAEARTRRVREIFLEVRADNPGAEALYETLGFERIGVRPHYYQPDDVDAIIMKLSLTSSKDAADEPN
jgi:ribosomal-protein-alanine N-acetyltransferase